MKNSSIWKIVGILFIAILALAVVFMLMPFVAVAGGIGFWYFSKKKPNERYRMFSLIALGVGIVGSIFAIPAFINSNQNNASINTQVTVPSSSSSSEKQSSTQSSSEDKSKESSEERSEPSSSSSSSSEQEKKEWTKETNAQFATYLMNEMNNKLAETGTPLSVRAEYSDSSLILLYVPQDFKYQSNTEVQQVVDSVLIAKNGLFSKWATENGYEPNSTNNPTLYVYAEDGTTLAEESAFSGTMKLKIDNN
ncbi:hypothetical protein JEQ21_08190 [Streptococcus sp. 121]|uniref:hypothetical protein n=1 Tax=Streptococcus sp. 121 TaxID=2797637 RepID=UPI0018F0F0EE|nr:hypothetical protein [Streptococcus sp. 121]MBJ6746429.1 hypothetical protein [Streptococcus sp. 121]